MTAGMALFDRPVQFDASVTHARTTVARTCCCTHLLYEPARACKNTVKPAEGEQAIVNGVRVTLLHNSLATMGGNSASSGTAPKTSQMGTSSPQEVKNQ